MSKFEYIQSMNITSIIIYYNSYHQLYYVDYDNRGYELGPNINQII